MPLPQQAKDVVRHLLTLSASWNGTLTHVATRQPAMALTFDDGPDPEVTPRLLELLDRHGARATFFMVGKAAADQPELVAEVAAAGHAIGNHSWDHPSLPLLQPRAARAQIRWCKEVLGGHDSGLFRPPYGDQTPSTQWASHRQGYRGVAWSGVADDWLDYPAAVLLDKLRPSLRPGAIVLLHDALYTTVDRRYCDRTPTLSAVDQLLGENREELSFVTVPELLALGKPRKKHWYRRGDLEWQRRLL